MEKSRKWCTDCKTTTTPLWRVGPAGPRTLCNACGIRYRKKKEGEVGSPSPSKNQQQQSKGGEQQQQDKSPQSESMSPWRQKKNNHPPQQQRKRDRPSGSSTSSLASSSGNGEVSKGLSKSQSLVESQVTKKQRSSRRLGEVERAAVLLLSLSWGSVSA